MGLSPEGEGGAELSAPSDPIRVTAWHALERASGTLLLRLEAFNRLTCDVRNAGVRCAPDLAALRSAPGPLVMADLWHIRLSCSGVPNL